MSRCFDTLARTFNERIAPHVPDSNTAMLFQAVLEEMHEANHRLGDAINKDRRVCVAAAELDDYLREFPLEPHPR